MPEEKMTLEERLNNPQWVNGPDPHSEAILDKRHALADMQEAMEEIRRLIVDRDAWRLTAKTYSRDNDRLWAAAQAAVANLQHSDK